MSQRFTLIYLSLILASGMLGPRALWGDAVGLTGADVSIAGYCCSAPIPADQFTNVLTGTVPVVFPVGALHAMSTLGVIPVSFDVEPTFLEADYTSAAISAGGTFNGYVFNFSGVSISAITGVTLDPGSSFTASQVHLSFTSDSVSASAPGLAFLPGDHIRVDLAFAPTAVPEPGSYAFIVAGMILAGFVVRRHVA